MSEPGLGDQRIAGGVVKVCRFGQDDGGGTDRMGRGIEAVRGVTLREAKRRLAQAPRDADFALDYIKQNARTRAEQEACVDAVRFKCNVLWSQLDALHHAYVEPGNIPPGAFRPD